MLYEITCEQTEEETVLTGKFGTSSSNDAIVAEVSRTLDKLQIRGGKLLKFTGPASLPVCACIIHHVAHLFSAVAVFDPKLQKFVVSISHDPNHKIGDLV
jgi:CRISPR-associated protein Csx3